MSEYEFKVGDKVEVAEKGLTHTGMTGVVTATSSDVVRWPIGVHINGSGPGPFFFAAEELRLLEPAATVDIVSHPPHYTAHPSGVECIQVTEHMGFNLGNAVKYIWRCDLKQDAVEDLKKARWYIDREIAKRVSA